MNFNPSELYQRTTDLGDDYADKNAAASLLEETRKTLLAKLALESTENSMHAKESRARCRPEYKEHVESMVEARRLADRAKVKYQAAQKYSDHLQTLSANERAEMRMSNQN